MKKIPLTISMMGRRGGLSRSSAKSEAARKNGLKGGRPAVKVNGKNGHEVFVSKPYNISIDDVKIQDPDDQPI